MEVHKHPHHVMQKKKWPEYLLEFSMIFLAVFLGFIAENMRERRVEKKIGKQYIQSFYKDLKTDISNIDTLLKHDEEKIAALKSMYQCYDTMSKNIRACECMITLVQYSKGNEGFILEDRTIQQLANTGGYRLLDKEDVDSITSYSLTYKNMDVFQTTMFQISQDNLRYTLSRLINFKYNAPLQDVTMGFDGSRAVFGDFNGEMLISNDPALLNHWFNQLALYLRSITIQRNLLIRLKTKAINLLRFYNTKYHFE